MKLRTTQFGARGNTASLRQHASRLAVSSPSPEPARAVELLQEEATASPSGTGNVEVFDLPLTEENGATVGKDRTKGNLLTVEEIEVRLGVSRNWVSSKASELGVHHLGNNLRLALQSVLERLVH